MNIGWTEEHCARLDEIASEDHSCVSTAAERARRENTWFLVRHSSGPNGPVNQREDYEEAEKTCQRLCQESGQAHHKLHPREQVRSLPNQPSTRRQAKSGTTLSKRQFFLPLQDGNHLRGGSLHHGHRHQRGVIYIFQGVSLTSNGDHLVSDGRCEHHTQPTRKSTRIFFTSAHVIFSRLAQDTPKRG